VALRENEERYRTLVGALQEGVLFIGDGEQILTCNDSALRQLGLSREQLTTLTLPGPGWQLLREDGAEMGREERPHIITLRTGQPLTEVVMGLRKPTGELIWLSVNTRALFRGGGPEPYAVVASFVDITQRKRSQEELQRQAFYDQLTLLPNRALFMDRVERALSQARRSEELVAVGYLDLDQFKQLNDTHGHLVGDLVLQQVAGRLCRCLREGDTVARMGGDEFTLLLPNVNGGSEAARVAERLLDALRQPLVIEQGDIHLTGSFGISIFPNDGLDAAELLRKADHAMYRAKSAGKNTYALYAGPPTSGSGVIIRGKPSRPPTLGSV
jgi:diguanylate cyclase (GGDEF)-like protein/PAS domain S-box-containing protein